MSEKQFIDVVKQSARAGGAVHQKYIDKGFSIKTKSTVFDLVTDADVEAEKVIVALIRETFPNHNILGEEGKYEKTDSPYTWIIDPLDGTNNFAFKLPFFGCSVALAFEGDLIAGAVYDVSRNEMFFAEKGKGAFVNDKAISVDDTEQIEGSLMVTGFYYDRGAEMMDNLERIKQFFVRNIMGLRRLGAASLDLCYIACGRATGFWEFELSPWDFAAGKLIIEEAGGKVTGRFGEPIDNLKKSYIVASNTKIHTAMLEILK